MKYRYQWKIAYWPSDNRKDIYGYEHKESRAIQALLKTLSQLDDIEDIMSANVRIIGSAFPFLWVDPHTMNISRKL